MVYPGILFKELEGEHEDATFKDLKFQKHSLVNGADLTFPINHIYRFGM